MVAEKTGDSLPGVGKRTMVVEQGYTWTRVPDTDLEVRVLANRPVVMRYRSRTASNHRYGGTQSS